MKRFRHQFEQIRTGGPVESNCNAITFVNKSDGDASVEGFNLAPDESLQLEGWPGENDLSKYEIQFAAAVTVPLMHVIRKIYQ